MSNPHRPYIALIVNCYNSEKYLSECIQSLLEQDYENFQIVCVDNKSTDSTLQMLSEYCVKDIRITLLRTEEFMSLVDARNFALEYVHSCGEFDYLAFCDSDDSWLPGWLNTLIDKGEGYNIVFSNGYELIDSNLTKVASCMSTSRHDVFSSPIYLQSCIISLDLFKPDNNGKFFDSRFSMHYDMDFFMGKREGSSFVHVSDNLFVYRVHSQSLSSNNKFSRFLERLALTKKHNLSLFRFFIISILRLIYPLTRIIRR